MEISQEELVKLVGQASNIRERLQTEFIANETTDDDDIVNSRIERWCEITAKGDIKKFHKRLAWDGLTSTSVRRLLGNVRLKNAQKLPPWAETFKTVISTAASMADQNPERGEADSCLNPEKPVPFEEVFLPFIQLARHKLIAKIGESYQCLTSPVRARLEWSLLSAIANLCCHPLELKFSAFRAQRQSALSRLIGQLQNTNSRHHYQAFIKETLNARNLLAFFQEYPVLARLVATKIDFWVETKSEFIQRLVADLPLIQQTFQLNADLGQINSIDPSISDPHNQGRSVIALSFESGLKIIYKPKHLGLETAYFKLLDWCNQQESFLEFKLLKILNRSNYGWVEFVEQSPCNDKAEVKRYYQRSGMLLCLLYILGANDCHNENLIACGEYPVLVDLETLMHHQFRDNNSLKDGMEALSQAQQQLADSVLRTGLLPRWDVGPDGRCAYDLSGLGGIGDQETSYRMAKWQNVNTDNMSLRQETVTMRSQANAACLDGEVISPNDRVEELVDGFEKMYRFLLARRNEFMAIASHLFSHQQVRCVVRATKIYATILQKSLHPKCLKDGAERSIELDVLSRAFLESEKKHPWWPILQLELQAMEQQDFPYFTAYTNSDYLSVSDGKTIEKCFAVPSYEQMVSKLLSLNDVDLNQQISIIRNCLFSRVAQTQIIASRSFSPAADMDASVPLSREVLVQYAVAIALELQQRAIAASDGSATWIGLSFMPQAQRFQLQPVGYGLYDGSTGIALFLAALTKFQSDTQFLDLTLGALQPLRKILRNSSPQLVRQIAGQIGISGTMGLGSIVYTLVRIGQFIDNASLFEDAKLAASFISADSIASDRHFDIMAGAAGAILGLLALHQITKDPEVLNLAVICGEHLLNHRITIEPGFKVWLTGGEKPLTGFSHGAAGIAYSLLRLYEVTEYAIFLEAALEAIAYERRLFSPSAGNWPDLRSFAVNNGKPSYMISWCHGAPGIGLARLGSLPILDTPEIRQEIAIALNTTQQCGLQNIDHPCCGNSGRIEFLMVASNKLSRSELLETAQKQAALMLARVKQTGAFHIFANLPKDVYQPGFFQGTAGIGYQLLRLAYPDLLPSVLLWE